MHCARSRCCPTPVSGRQQDRWLSAAKGLTFLKQSCPAEPFAASERAHECRRPAGCAFDHNLVWLERFDRARDSGINAAHILGIADVQGDRLSADRPGPADRSRDALTERVADEPAPPYLGCEPAVGCE